MVKKFCFSLILILFLLFSMNGLFRPVQTVSAAINPLIKTEPANGATNLSALTVTLKWSSSLTGDITYSYCLRTNNKCQGSKNKWVTVGSGTELTVHNLNPNTWYYWQVRAKNNASGEIIYADGGTMHSFKTTALPGVFNKTSPVNMATEETIGGVTLQWGISSSDTTSYEYCYDSTNNNWCDSRWINVGTQQQVVLPALNNNTVYYWQVRAGNGSGFTQANGGTWWSFTTQVLPGIFNKISPANFATNQLVQRIDLSWTIQKGATSYQYCISQSSSGCTGGTWVDVGNTTNAQVTTGLAYDTNYYWQVRAVNGSASQPADSNAWWTFRTQAPPPGAFGKSTPENNATDQEMVLTLSWAASPGTGITYEICYDTTLDLPCNGLWTEVGAAPFVEVELDYELVYYWQVRARNSTGVTEANDGLWWTFVTKNTLPGDFTKTAPVYTDSPLPLDLTFGWSLATGKNITYSVCYDVLDNNQCDSIWHPAGTGQTFAPPDLVNNTTYYWQVRAANPSGGTNADANVWWHFNTVLKPPAFFTKLFPGDNASGLPTNIPLSWSASSGTGITYQYCLDIETVNDNQCNSGWVSASSTSVSPNNLQPGQTYWWQVRAVNSALSQGMVEADGGAWQTFAIASETPGPFVKVLPKNNEIGLPVTLQPITPWLAWSASANASAYEYCILLIDSPATDCTQWVRTTSLLVHLADAQQLENGKTYKWQVRAINNDATETMANETTWFQFTTVPMLPVLADQSFSMAEDGTLESKIDNPSGADLTFIQDSRMQYGSFALDPDGSFRYTPPQHFWGVVYFSFLYWDRVNPPSRVYTVPISISSENDTPDLADIPPMEVFTGKLISFTAVSTDPDLLYGDHLTYTIANPLGSSAQINPSTGKFNWVPSWIGGQSNDYTFTIRVTDTAGAYREKTAIITVVPYRLKLPIVKR